MKGLSAKRTRLLCATILMNCAPMGLIIAASPADAADVAPAKARQGAGKKAATPKVAAAPAMTQTASATGPTAAAARPTATNAPAAGPEQVYVTATRRRTRLEDSPINISVLDNKTLQAERITDIKQFSAFVPGLTVTDTGPGNAGNIIMRGLSSGNTSTTGNFSNNAVGVYLGEVPLYTDFKLIDINRVEVLQGPQGTLYGLGTLAGAVRYMPNRPDTEKWSADIDGKTFGMAHSSDPGGEINGTFNIPILKDHIAFRTVIGYYNDPGWIDYNHVLKDPGVSSPQPGNESFGTPAQQRENFNRYKDVNYDHTFTTRNQLLLQLNPNIKAYLTYAHQETKTAGQQANGAGVMGTGHDEGPWRYLEPVDRTSDLYSGELNFNIPGIMQIVSTTAYTQQNIHQTEDNTDLLIDLDYGYQAFPNFSSYANNQRKYRQFNEELRLVSTHKGPFNWVVGGFYNQLKTSYLRQEYVPGYSEWAGYDRPDELEYASFVYTTTTEKAVYGEGTLHLLKNLQVTGGIRYFNYDATVDGGTALPLFQAYPGVSYNEQRGATGADGVIWKANISYRFNPNVMAYFTYSTGYRVGGVNRVAPCTLPVDPSSQHACALPNEMSFQPDRTRNEELGIRANFFHHRVMMTLAGFHIDWLDVQVPSRTKYGNVGITANGAQAVSQGFDATASWKVTPNFSLTATYSYTDAHLTRTTPDLVNGLYTAYAGDRLPGSMKNSGSLIANYVIPLKNERNIVVNWATTYNGSIYSHVGLRGYGEKIPSYVTHRASVTYNTKKWSLDFFINNIFDQYAVTAVSNDYGSVRSRDGVVERYYAYGMLTPRTFGMEGHIHF
ncbi:TonB-dependent receptor [Gluconacetobacter johannae DSM 13595]|uniref:TonB-dependent receptor n=2 Tax=Gluconacetobacter johannae TaxID=112140 RepID=A0A7W4J5Z5_9PROT|nr:TonB-dependent receptor [Gluconacetobacter johannae]GBQ80748.1 TonB-dependent receptor [Gluconacetobacter johannae DSM 13595]